MEGAPFELIIAAGNYRGQALALKGKASSVVVRGPEHGVVEGLQLRVEGVEVAVSRLRFSGNLSGGVALRIAASQVVYLAGVRFVGLRIPSAGNRSTHGALEVQATGAAVRVDARDLWFVDNDIPDVPVRWSTANGANFASIRVVDSVWADDAPRALQSSQVLGSLTYERNVVVLKGEPFVVPVVTRGMVQVRDSWLSVPSVDGIMVASSGGSTPPMEFTPIRLVDSHLFAADLGEQDPGTLVEGIEPQSAMGWPDRAVTDKLRTMALGEGTWEQAKKLLFPDPSPPG